MYKILRIICTVISALCIAAAVPVFIFLKEIPGIICVVVALLFFVLMMLFKSLQEMNEPTPTGESEITSAEQNSENSPAEQHVEYLDAADADKNTVDTEETKEKSEN